MTVPRRTLGRVDAEAMTETDDVAEMKNTNCIRVIVCGVHGVQGVHGCTGSIRTPVHPRTRARTRACTRACTQVGIVLFICHTSKLAMQALFVVSEFVQQYAGFIFCVRVCSTITLVHQQVSNCLSAN